MNIFVEEKLIILRRVVLRVEGLGWVALAGIVAP